MLYENMHIADDVCSDLCDKPNFGKKLWSKIKFIFINLSERHTAVMLCTIQWKLDDRIPETTIFSSCNEVNSLCFVWLVNGYNKIPDERTKFCGSKDLVILGVKKNFCYFTSLITFYYIHEW